MRPTSLRYALVAAVAAAASVVLTPSAHAAPYASGITNNGSLVSFVLNEPADLLSVSINGGAPILLDGSTKGTKSFAVSSLSDTFTITATKNDSVGYTIPTGGTVASDANGLSQTTNASGFRLISDDANVLDKFNSPRGVTSQINPNQPSFGTTYVANSASGSTGGRTLGDGLYALKADQSDATGNGNTAATGGITAWATSASSSAPFRLTASPSDGNVYIADFSDATGTVWRMSPVLTAGTQVLAVSGGPSAIPAGQNHGSSTAVYVEGSSANGNLTVYTVDEDLTQNQFGQGGSNTDKNNLWQYNVGNDAAMPYNGTPTRINQGSYLITAATSDLDRGADGKWYLAQNRGAGNEPGIVVLDAAGSKIYDSLSDSRTLLNDPAAVDILRNVQGMAVSPDQKWMALMLNNSDVAVVPLVNGIPDIANRLIADTGTNVNSGRDISFDAADNILYVSSGQGLYRVLSPGGTTSYATSWDGTSYAFAAVPEPVSTSLLALGSLALASRRRRA